MKLEIRLSGERRVGRPASELKQRIGNEVRRKLYRRP